MDATGSRCRVELLAAFVSFLPGAPTNSLFLSFLARWPPAQTFLHDLHGHNRQQVSCRTLGPAFCLLDFRFLPPGHRQPHLFLSFLPNMGVIPSVSGTDPSLPAPLLLVPSHYRPTAL